MTTIESPAADMIVDLPVAAIAPECNDRTVFADAALRELARSIEENGLAQPITVRPGPIGYHIVAGERRWRAHKIAGLATIRCIVRDLTDTEAADIMAIENLNRVDLNPVDEARCYQARIDRFGWTAEQIAVKYGKSAAVVRRRLALLDLAPTVLAHLESGNFWISGAEDVCPLDHNRQVLALRAFLASGGMTGAEWTALVTRLRTEQNTEAGAANSMFDTDFMVLDEYVATAKRDVKPGVKALAALLARSLGDVTDPVLAAEIARAVRLHGVDTGTAA